MTDDDVINSLSCRLPLGRCAYEFIRNLRVTAAVPSRQNP